MHHCWTSLQISSLIVGHARIVPQEVIHRLRCRSWQVLFYNIQSIHLKPKKRTGFEQHLSYSLNHGWKSLQYHHQLWIMWEYCLFVHGLNLKSKNFHPQQYKIIWSKKRSWDNYLPILYYYFLIGNTCIDSVRCHVTPIDARHILVGHPWQYDQEAMHSERGNTQTFNKDKIILKPIRKEWFLRNKRYIII